MVVLDGLEPPTAPLSRTFERYKLSALPIELQDHMARSVGFEPTPYSLEGCCPIRLDHERVEYQLGLYPLNITDISILRL